ncbi:MAG TPA: TIGR00730 family Rossman fold protein [Candidatus Binatia bacterium]|nr:TIGR00730 family Rossman fold protein [Candidatus Binatia bacterium]
MLRRVCVFCGSSQGARPAYGDAATKLGVTLARRSIELVYGGGNIGLMGVLADATLAAGGKVIGVIPESLRRLEVAHEGLSDLRVVHSMHERKAVMADLSDGFVALPGGLGTFEELLEIMTWSQLGIHNKPVGLLDVAGYFDALVALLQHAVAEKFLRIEHYRQLLVATEPDALVEQLAAYRPPLSDVAKWIDRDQR